MFDEVIVLTQRDKLAFERDQIKHVTVIPNPNVMKVTEFAEPLKKKYQIIAVGRLEYQKGFDLLIKSFAMVSENVRRDWVLHVYGEGSLRDELQQLIDKNRLSNSIILKGLTTQIEMVYPNYDFFVLSSRFEGFGMVILEAMACGLPVISYDCPTGPRELLQNGVAGVLVEENSIEKLSQAIQMLMQDDNLRLLLSKKGIDNSKKYTLDKIVESWKKIF